MDPLLVVVHADEWNDIGRSCEAAIKVILPHFDKKLFVQSPENPVMGLYMSGRPRVETWDGSFNSHVWGHLQINIGCMRFPLRLDQQQTYVMVGGSYLACLQRAVFSLAENNHFVDEFVFPLHAVYLNPHFPMEGGVSFLESHTFYESYSSIWKKRGFHNEPTHSWTSATLIEVLNAAKDPYRLQKWLIDSHKEVLRPNWDACIESRFGYACIVWKK